MSNLEKEQCAYQLTDKDFCKIFQEMDTESPVVWPAWCYSGKNRVCFLKICIFPSKTKNIIPDDRRTCTTYDCDSLVVKINI